MLLTLLLAWVYRHGFMELGHRPVREGGLSDVLWTKGSCEAEEDPVLRARQRVQEREAGGEATCYLIQRGVLVQL